MLHRVNIALQVLPSSTTKHPYTIIDKAIELIQKSGLKYRVCPFETVIEGEYDQIMELIKKIQLECLDFGAEKLLTNLKIEMSRDKDVAIEDKTGKYD